MVLDDSSTAPAVSRIMKMIPVEGSGERSAPLSIKKMRADAIGTNKKTLDFLYMPDQAGWATQPTTKYLVDPSVNVRFQRYDIKENKKVEVPNAQYSYAAMIPLLFDDDVGTKSGQDANGSGTNGDGKQLLAMAPNDALRTLAKETQSLIVDSKMIDPFGNIHAVGYIDMLANGDDSNGSVMMDNDTSNRVAWASVNGVTNPAALLPLNTTNTGPAFGPVVNTDDVVVDEQVDILLPPMDVGHISRIGELWTDVTGINWYNLPWSSDHERKNVNSIMHDYVCVRIQAGGSTITTNPSLLTKTQDAIKVYFDFTRDTTPEPDTYSLDIRCTIEPGTYPELIFSMFTRMMLGVTHYSIYYQPMATTHFLDRIYLNLSYLCPMS